MILHIIPMLKSYNQLKRQLTVLVRHVCWFLLWLIGSSTYFTVASYILVPVDYSLFIHLLSNILLFHNVSGGLFISLDKKIILRLTAHIVLIVFYWPFVLYFDIPHIWSCPIYLIISTLEFAAGECILLDDCFMNKKNDKGPLILHLFFLFSSFWILLKLSVSEFNQFVYFLLNYVFHSCILPAISKCVIDQIQNFVNWYQHRYLFFRRYSVFKCIIYFFMQCVILCCGLCSAFAWIYLQNNLMFVFHKHNGLQIVNVTEQDKNITLPLDFTTPYSHGNHFAHDLALFDSIRTGRKTLQEKMVNRKCEKKEYFIGEDVELEYHIKKYSALKSYFWRHNDTVILEYSDEYIHEKYHVYNYTYDDELRGRLNIRNLGNDELGKYTLVEEVRLTPVDVYTYNIFGTPFRFTILNNLQKGIFFRKELKSVCIVREKLKVITVFSGVGYLLRLSHFKFRSTFDDYEPKYTIDGKNDIMSICGKDSCYKTISNRYNVKQGYQKDSVWNHLLNVTFCVCPQAYSRQLHTLQFVNKYSKEILTSPIQINLNPSLDDIFSKKLVNSYIDCQNSGYIYLKDFFLCLQRSGDKWKQFQGEITNMFNLQWYSDVIICVVAFLSPFLLFLLFDKYVKMFLSAVFHPDLFTRRRHNLQMDDTDFDVYISYCEDSVHDTTFALETIGRFTRDKLGYRTKSTHDIQPGEHRRKAFEYFIASSKTLIIILSRDYIDNDACIQEYDFALLPLLGVSRLHRNNILLLKTDTCPIHASPLALFSAIDWSNTVTNIRTEEEKQEELQRWLTKRLGPSLFRVFCSGIYSVFQVTCEFLDAIL